MKRLFVAINIPEDIRMLICGMGGSIPGSRVVPTEQLHLTLKFLGDVETGMIADIHDALTTISQPVFRICLKNTGYFPPRGNPRVLWVGADPVHEVVKLRNSIEKALSDAGIARDTRKFSPHITIARLKNSPINRVTQFLAGNSFFETPPFTVDRFHLYSSILSSKGAAHKQESTFYLA